MQCICSGTITTCYIDLGLPSGLKWASCNVGATIPEEYGDYFAWGETSPKSEYTWENYKFRVSGNSFGNVTFNRYCFSSTTEFWGGSGSPDNKTDFKDYDYADDAARANWNGSWRTPTVDEWRKLYRNCSLQMLDNYNGSGVKGLFLSSRIEGFRDKSIFIPAAGYCYDHVEYAGSYCSYWSSSLYTESPGGAWHYDDYYGDGLSIHGMVHYSRSGGRSVRPVTD